MASPRTPETFKPLLKKFALSPSSITPAQVKLAFEHVARGAEGATPAQVGAFLACLRLNGLDDKAEVIAGAAAVLREHAVRLPEVEGMQGVADIVGTGGDGLDTFNVSTSAAIVAAGAGAIVAKHGSRSSTSASGSADLLTSLSCSLTLPPSLIPSILSSSSFAFLFAPNYHPALAHVAPLRKELAFPTIFNVLGPLISPARPENMVVGVARKELAPVFVEALRMLGVKRALVVRGREGMDEISPEQETDVWELNNSHITTYSLSPASFGLPPHPLSRVSSGTPQQNATLLLSLLSNTPAKPKDLAPGVDPDAVRDWVLMNASAVLVVAGKAKDWKEGVELARRSLERGAAGRALEGFRKVGEEEK